MPPSDISKILTSQLRKGRLSLSEDSGAFPIIFFLVMLDSAPRDRAPRTRKLQPYVFHLAEWAPEAVMILLAASHKFLVRKRTFVTLFGLS